MRQKLRHAEVKEIANVAIQKLNLGAYNLHAPTIFFEVLSKRPIGVLSTTTTTISQYTDHEGEQKLSLYAQKSAYDMFSERYTFETICEHVAEDQYSKFRPFLDQYQGGKKLTVDEKEQWIKLTEFLLQTKICSLTDLITQDSNKDFYIPVHFFEQLPYYICRWSLCVQLEEGVFNSIERFTYRQLLDPDVALSDIKKSGRLNEVKISPSGKAWQTLLTEPLVKKHFYRFVATLDYTNCDPNHKNQDGDNPLMLTLRSESKRSPRTQFFVVHSLLKLPAPTPKYDFGLEFKMEIATRSKRK